MDSKERLIQRVKVYTEIVKQIASLSKSSSKKVGCVALKKDFTKIASFGYNGSYRGSPINPETGTEEDSLEPGKSGFIHAEVNMITKFQEKNPEDYIVLLTLSPCIMCTKILVNAGFKHIYWIEEYRETSHLSILRDSGINYGDLDTLIHNYETNGIS